MHNVTLMYLYGYTTFYREAGDGTFIFLDVCWKTIFRCFSIPAGVVHWFTPYKKALLFITFSKPKGPILYTESLAKDFKLT